MYLAETINKILESKKGKLIGKTPYAYICTILNRAFAKNNLFKFKFETYDNFGRNNYSVSGIYDMDQDEKYIILNFSSDRDTFTIRPNMWEEFKFSISQVCQHESIHQCQWSFRSVSNVYQEKLDFRNVGGLESNDQDYLSDIDEIDAYGHDIAMEIYFYYPKKNPYNVLININRYRKLWSYQYYLTTFDNDEWTEIRNRLLKKVYKWLPEIKI